eukprot:TRINITY_DN46675_c0_g1_i1.p1 TRINITY_DN46675_c0_g1~~TRINITY_DN46675_c0_g1_i1.p1  ORF type:complete len:412 (+),score=107.44 TRINITY_DN46675_c0_g1_i1:46-1281(+)
MAASCIVTASMRPRISRGMRLLLQLLLPLAQLSIAAGGTEDALKACHGPAAIGIGAVAEGYDPALALASCGAAFFKGALDRHVVEAVFESFLKLSSDDAASLRHGSLREKRLQTHLPFSAPFDGLELLGGRGELRRPLEMVLGPGYDIDLVTVVTVPPRGKEMAIHRDSPKFGSIAVHVPLHPIDESFGPLGVCTGTHNFSKDDAGLVTRESLLWKHPSDASSNKASIRLFCGGRQQTDVLTFRCDATRGSALRVRDGRLGAAIFKVPPEAAAEGCDWRVADEITQVNGKAVADSDELHDAMAEARGPVEFLVERPHQGSLPEPPRKVVAAPLEVGDILVYDSRVYHWGLENSQDKPRHALFINFKAAQLEGGVHPEAAMSQAVKDAQAGFQAKFLQLREEAANMQGHADL